MQDNGVRCSFAQMLQCMWQLSKRQCMIITQFQTRGLELCVTGFTVMLDVTIVENDA